MKRKLFLLLCTLLGLLSSVQGVKAAYTDYLNAANGYEEVTSASELANADYYYVFASAENSDMIVGITDISTGLPSWYSGTAKILCYKNLSSNPISDATYFFIIENNSGYEMYNVGYNSSTKFQTHTDKAYLWVNTGYSNSDDYTKFIPAFDDTNKYWTLQNNKYPTAESKDANGWYGFLGPWTAKYVADGEHLAANRTNVSGDDAGHFKIYRIKRTRYAKDAQINNPDVTNAYITNPSFELGSTGTATKLNYSPDNLKDDANSKIYGWTKSFSLATNNGNWKWQNLQVYTSEDTNNSGYGSTIVPSDGNYYYFWRQGWTTNTLTLSTTSISTLPAGVYTLSVDYKGATTGGTSKVTIKAKNGETELTTAEAAYVTKNPENDADKTYFQTSDWKTVSTSFVLETGADVTFEIVQLNNGSTKVGNNSSRSDVCLDNVRLRYSPFADADDYAELTTAISTAEAYTLGFDVGEYASYNVLPILNAAKTIKSDENNGYSTVRELINALNGITANATEVNAFYDGNFAIQSEQTTGPTALAGWNNPEGIRQLIKNTETYPGLNSASAKAAVFAWGSTNLIYGEKAGYTIPLKGHTIYELSLKICGWQDGDMGYVNVDVKNTKNEGLATYTTASVTKRITESEPWAEYNLLFTTGDAGIYKFGMWTSKHTTFTDLVLKKATAEKIKPLLLTEITNANNIYNDGANVGTGVFQIPVAAGTAFAGAIAEARTVYDNASATADDVTAAISSLKAAEETYANAELNAPDSEKRYTVILKAGTYDGKAITYLANGRNDMGNYNVQYLKEPNSNYAQAFKFTQVSGNTYKMSQIDVDGNTRYICTGVPYSGNTSQIRTTTDASKALVVRIEATSTANIFNIYNTEANNYIGSQDAGVYTVISNKNFTIAEATQVSPNLTIAAGVNWATFISPFAVSLSEMDKVQAYKVTGVDGEGVLTTEEVETSIPANTPVLLHRTTTGMNYTPSLSGYGTAWKDTYTEGLMTGSYILAEIPYSESNNYGLQKHDSKVAFYNITSEGIKVGAYRAYLTKPVGSSARGVLFFPGEGEATAVNAIEAAEAENSVKDGKYLENGKIVIVKNGVKYSANGQKLN